ncbi:MAG TPA: LPS export ABC transporter periplasmic protein LptC [Dongiaceae bacterium]|nr:LPS export ABC transporter periplasmic protein LptC [Dongiaceae bacterium]
MTDDSEAADFPDQPAPPIAPTAPEPGQMRRLSTPRGRPLRRRKAPLTFLKIALPLIAIVTVAYLVYWWWVQASERVITVEKMQNVGPTEKAEVTVNDVKYDGKDDKGRPYSITAEAASHADGDERHIALKKPLADIVMSNGAYVALTAQEGMLDRDSDIITLNGDVTLFHDNGLSFQTDSATINMKDKTAEGSAPVEGQNGDGELFSEGFRVQDEGDTIVFTGKAYMKIYPKQKNQEPAAPVQQEPGQENQGG